jgi:hypothetical protein
MQGHVKTSIVTLAHTLRAVRSTNEFNVQRVQRRPTLIRSELSESDQCDLRKRLYWELGVRSVQSFMTVTVYQVGDPSHSTTSFFLPVNIRQNWYSLEGCDGQKSGKPEKSWLIKPD